MASVATRLLKCVDDPLCQAGARRTMRGRMRSSRNQKNAFGCDGN